MEYKRAERVAELIKEELAVIIQRQVHDPRIMLTTVTDVKVTDDLKHAKVYYICDAEKKDEAKAGFDRSKGFIRKMLASQIRLKFMPDIVFYYDESFDRSSKIEKILKEIKEKDDK